MPRKPYVRKKPYEPTRYCAHCSTPLRAGGRRQADPEAPRFCMDPACQSEKKARLTRISRYDRADAPTECSGCHDPLPARKVRRDDSPLGRWCQKAACQRHRDAIHQHHASGAASSAEVVLTLEFASAALDPELTQTCEACGLATAVVGFIHPARDDDGAVTPCFALGKKGAPKALASKRWPEFFAEAAS